MATLAHRTTEELVDALRSRGCAVHLWTPERLIRRVKHVKGIEISKSDAVDILYLADQKCDDSYGLTWNVLEIFIDDFYT